MSSPVTESRADPCAVESRSSCLDYSVGSVAHISLSSQGFPAHRRAEILTVTQENNRREMANNVCL